MRATTTILVLEATKQYGWNKKTILIRSNMKVNTLTGITPATFACIRLLFF